MSRGHIARASRRYPSIQRQAARYGRTIRVRRATGLPPHLLPGVTGRQERRGPNRTHLLLVAAFVLTLGTIIAIVSFIISALAFSAGTVEAYKKVNASLPNAGAVVADTFQSTRIYDRNGVLLQEVTDPDRGWRTFEPLDKISPNLINATVSAEDATFWSNYGVEPIGILRAALINFSGAGTSGASTITQQLVRSLYPNEINPNDISITRKVKEAMAAVELTRRYSKNDILTMYLNQIFYGNHAYGIEAASEIYFNKHASDLDLAEASLLAGLPQAPTYYDPTVNFDIAKKRQQYVLNQMVKYKYITPEQRDAAFAEPLQIQNKQQSGVILHAPHFVNFIHDYIVANYGEDALYRGGLNIYTTLDVNLQDQAQQIVQNDVANVEQYNVHNAAMVAMIPWSGEILAMVGSANWNDPTIDGQVNMAVAPRQPGSAMKPITYAAAFEDGWNPATIIFDDHFVDKEPGAPVYEPQNYTGQYYGAVPVRIALANSFNIPAVKTLQYVGLPHFLDLAHRMGLKHSLSEPLSHYGLSLTLGGGDVSLLELTNVYATFANNGRYVPFHPILKITDSQGHVVYDLDRQTVFERGQQVLRAEYAYQITSILTDNNARSMMFTANNLFGNTQTQLGRPTAAKSGTTDNWVDNWSMGYTTDLAVGVWAGNDDNSPLAQIDGITGAGPIWHDIMVLMHQNPTFAQLLNGPDGQPLPKAFSQPPGIYQGTVCAATGQRATGGSMPGGTKTELLVQGGGPALACNQLSAYELSQLQGALQDAQAEPGQYASYGPGVRSVYQYAQAVGLYSGTLRGASGTGNGNSNSSSSPAIVPRGSNNNNGNNGG